MELRRFKEVAARNLMSDGRSFNKGDVRRVVSLTDKQVKINNEMTDEHGWQYEPEEKERLKPGPKPKK